MSLSSLSLWAYHWASMSLNPLQLQSAAPPPISRPCTSCPFEAMFLMADQRLGGSSWLWPAHYSRRELAGRLDRGNVTHGHSPTLYHSRKQDRTIYSGPFQFMGLCTCTPGLDPPCLSPMRLGALGASGPSEATSLERLFSMALVLADKPYQLISPSHRQTESALANGTLEVPGCLPCRFRKVQMAGDLEDTHTVHHPGTQSSTDTG